MTGMPLHPLEAWSLTEEYFDPAANVLNETLFALGNGSIGVRGAHEEGSGGAHVDSLDGTYLNGFYDTEPIQYPETAYGLARTNEFMLKVPDGKRIELFVEGEPFSFSHGTLHSYRRTLDFQTGILHRALEWEAPGGQRLAVVSDRLVSFEHQHVFAIRYEVTALNFSGRIRLVAALDGNVANLEAGDDPRVGAATSGPVLQLTEVIQDGDFSALVQRTRHSHFLLVTAMETEVSGDATSIARSTGHEGMRVDQQFDLLLTEGRRVTLTKFGAYVSSRDYAETAVLPLSREVLALARAAGFDGLRRSQSRFLTDFWHRAEVEISGDAALAQGMHFNQFHLLQSVGRDGKTAIAAKGVTGEGYGGHYFWDTEIYVFPFFLFTNPAIARSLLEYRYSTLEAARTRARQMSHPKGALYPWRTIAGEECSAYFPAGTAQYHINADIVYAIKQYTEVTGDQSFLYPRGAEIVLDTARIWMGIGAYIPAHGDAFCINEVTGPDEYSALVNNNYYTNAMAQLHLRFAADVAEALAARDPEQFSQIAATLDLDPEEPRQWRQVADRMYLPYDQRLGVHPQDDSFLARQVWDFANTPADHYPLLLHYHPLVIYRYQVCKQADVVLALLLLGEQFSLEEKQRDFSYYEAVTTHDSSLSTAVFGIMATELGYHEKAYAYFMETARMDLDNRHKNSQYGVHTAAMAGTWLGLTYGFAGMRVYSGLTRFAPTLPAQWQQYRFKVRLHGTLLQVSVDSNGTEYRLLEGDALTLRHHAGEFELTAGKPVQSFSAG